MKRIISFILVLALSISMAPAVVKAGTNNFANGVKDDFTYGSSSKYYAFGIDNKGVPYAEIELYHGMSKGSAYYLYDMVSKTKLQDFIYNGEDNMTQTVSFGKNYAFVISDEDYTPEQIAENADSYFVDYTKVSVPTVEAFGQEISDKVSNVNVYSKQIDRFNLEYYCAGPHAIYIDGKFIVNNTTSKGNYSYYRAGFKAGSTHTVKILPYVAIGNVNFLGKEVTKKITIAKFAKTAKPKVTKLTKNKVSVFFNVPAAQQVSGVSTFYVYMGNKKVKTVKNTGKASYIVTVSKKGIGKKKIKIVAKCKATKKTAASKAAKPATNQYKWNYSENLKSYSTISEYVRPIKYYYSGSKLTVKGMYINTHILDLKTYKVKFKLTVNNKVVATKILTVKNLKGNSIKKFTVTMKKGKYYDLRNSTLGWSYETLAATV